MRIPIRVRIPSRKRALALCGVSLLREKGRFSIVCGFLTGPFDAVTNVLFARGKSLRGGAPILSSAERVRESVC